MAQMFARSNLVTWDNGVTTGCWSNTSGGLSNATTPTSTTDVVFDGNSGAARAIAITAGALCSTVTTAAAASGFSFTGANVAVYGATANLTGCTSVAGLDIQTTCSLTPSTTMASLTTAGSGTLTLQGNLNVTSLSLNTHFNANNFNYTSPSFSVSGTNTLTMGSGTWTITGNGGGIPWSVAAGTTVVPGTSTIKLTDNSTQDKTFTGAGKTYNNIWNATQGTGVLTLSGANTFNNYRTDAGRTNQFPASTTTTVASMTADGTGNQITIQSDASGTPGTLAKSGGGSIYLDYCSIKDITGSPAATWNARNSTNVSGNSNINFIPNNTRFLSFF